MSDNQDWDCPSCGRPTPTEIDVECHCGMMSSHHVSVRELCKRLRESQQRESALIVENNEQARLLGMSGERECDLRGKLERERSLSNQLAGALMVTRWDSYAICTAALAAWKEARFE